MLADWFAYHVADNLWYVVTQIIFREDLGNWEAHPHKKVATLAI